MIGEGEIRALIPHAGAMCLLRHIESWDDECIHCTTDSHLDPDHPLRRGDILPALSALEYGAQAMAIHGALLARKSGRALLAGRLAAIRDLRVHVERLDHLTTPMHVRARRLIVQGGNLIYAIEVSAGEKALMEARVSVMRSAGAGE